MIDAGAMEAATELPSIPVAAGLQCTLCSSAGENEDETNNNKLELFFRPDETKKSVFWLDAPDSATSESGCHSVNAPGHCYIEHCQSTIFFLGGFQLVSNAKTVEIFTVSADSNKEEYLTTSRGIPSQETPGSFKVMCVVPGGPRPIVRLYLKLLSLKPATDDPLMAKLVSIKLTARIPAAQAAATTAGPQSTSTMPSNNNTSSTGTAPSLASMMNNTSSALPNQQQQQQQQQAPGPTMDDVGAAMAGVSFMVRSTEERLVETMQAGFSQLHTAAQQNSQSNQTVDTRLQVLQQTVVQQTHMLERQHVTMQQQHVLLEQQGQALETLKQQQQDLLSAFESMQTQFVTTDTPPPPPSRTESEPGIVEAVAGAITVEEIDEQPLKVPEADAVQVDEAVSNDHAFGEFSEDTLDESDVVFVENDDATSSSTPEKEPVRQDSEELHIGNDDAPAFVDGGEGSDELILVTDDE
jgi:hypothetical protein